MPHLLFIGSYERRNRRSWWERRAPVEISFGLSLVSIEDCCMAQHFDQEAQLISRESWRASCCLLAQVVLRQLVGCFAQRRRREGGTLMTFIACKKLVHRFPLCTRSYERDVRGTRPLRGKWSGTRERVVVETCTFSTPQNGDFRRIKLPALHRATTSIAAPIATPPSPPRALAPPR